MLYVAGVFAVTCLVLAEIWFGAVFFPYLSFYSGIAWYPDVSEIERMMRTWAAFLYVGAGILVSGQILAFVFAIPRVRAEREGRLATTGPFAVSRHPMYLIGALSMTLGFGLMFNNWLVAITIGFVNFFWVRHGIRREEAYLLEQFGNEYRNYSLQVGIIPRIRLSLKEARK